jgi:single-strand DNA-binding protein
MSSLNKVQLIGNLGADPETRYTGSGAAVTNLRIATTERWTDKQSGEKQEHTEWHTIVLWNRLAEIAGEYLAKGSKVYIEGKLRTEKYTDKDGVERWTTKILGTQLIMLSSQQGDGGGQQQQRQGNGGGRSQGGNQQRNNSQSTQRHQGPPPQQDAFDDDDIPF